MPSPPARSCADRHSSEVKTNSYLSLPAMVNCIWLIKNWTPRSCGVRFFLSSERFRIHPRTLRLAAHHHYFQGRYESAARESQRFLNSPCPEIRASALLLHSVANVGLGNAELVRADFSEQIKYTHFCRLAGIPTGRFFCYNDSIDIYTVSRPGPTRCVLRQERRLL